MATITRNTEHPHGCQIENSLSTHDVRRLQHVRAHFLQGYLKQLRSSPVTEVILDIWTQDA